MPDNESKYVELFYDHYKDTFEQIKGYIKRRNICTVIILCLLVFLSFQATNPKLASSISTEVVSKNIGNIQIDFEYIKSILYIALLWVLATYYRTTLTIEKHYKYIHEIEEKLSNTLSPFKIEREGKSYYNNYPFFLTLIDILYTITLPVSIFFFAIFSWIYEKNNMDNNTLHFWVNTFIIICISIVPLLYISHIHFNDFKKKYTQCTKEVLAHKKTESVEHDSLKGGNPKISSITIQ
jgi:hypothetical protein